MEKESKYIPSSEEVKKAEGMMSDEKKEKIEERETTLEGASDVTEGGKKRQEKRQEKRNRKISVDLTECKYKVTIFCHDGKKIQGVYAREVNSDSVVLYKDGEDLIKCPFDNICSIGFHYSLFKTDEEAPLGGIEKIKDY